jgi:Terminase large subunit, T4likevirus-type, N-terminal
MPSVPTKRRALRLPKRLIRRDPASDGAPDPSHLVAERYALARALDATRVMREIGLTPDRWQVQLLRSGLRRHLVLCSRQSGKSTTAACMAVSEALVGAAALVLLVSPTMRQSLELYRKVRYILATLQHTPRLRRDSGHELEFLNGSRIVSLPGEEGNIRGYSRASHIVIDEAARVPDDLYRAIRPMLAVSNGRLTCLSTPWRQEGWFYEAWASVGTEWRRTMVTAVECPRISPKFLDEEQRELGPAAFAREYMCEFSVGAYRVFDPALVRAAFVASVTPLLHHGEM